MANSTMWNSQSSRIDVLDGWKGVDEFVHLKAPFLPPNSLCSDSWQPRLSPNLVSCRLACFVGKLFIIITQHQNEKPKSHLASFFDWYFRICTPAVEKKIQWVAAHCIDLNCKLHSLHLLFSSPVSGVRTRFEIWSNVKRAHVHFLNF